MIKKIGKEINKEKAIETLKILLDREEIVFSYVFGSFIFSSSFNDIDIAIYLKEDSPYLYDRWYDIRLALKLEEKIGIPVDLIIINNAPDHLIYDISKGKVIIDKDEDLRLDFITRAWKRYFDFKVKREQFLREMFE